VVSLPGVVVGVLARRRVATTDVATRRTASKMEPPASCIETFEATVTGRLYVHIDLAI